VLNGTAIWKRSVVAHYISLSYSLPGPVSDATQLLLSECFGRDATRRSDSSDEECQSWEGRTYTGPVDAEEWVAFCYVYLQLLLTAGGECLMLQSVNWWEINLEINSLVLIKGSRQTGVLSVQLHRVQLQGSADREL
jgi:hypothetical protein